jgi:Pectate lyase superfamily protein
MKRKLFPIILALAFILFSTAALASSQTTNLKLNKPGKGDRSWGQTVNDNMDKLDAVYGNFNSVADDLPEVYVYTDTFNSTTGTTITLPNPVDAVTEYSVTVTPTTRAGVIGDIYVTKTTTNFVVKCSEANTTDTFAAVVYYIGDVSNYGGSIYRRWYVSPDTSVTDHGNASTTGSLAWVAAQISTSPAIIEAPGNKTYQLKQSLTLADNISYQPQPGAIIDTDFSIRDSNYEWYQNGATNEYYLQASGGGNPNINMPGVAIENNAQMTKGAAGSLAAGEWDWSDVNGLGYSTVYVYLSDGTDPDGKAADYVEAGYTLSFGSPENIIAGDRQQIMTGIGVLAFAEGGRVPVFWCGAAGDGSTDDSSVIQIAIDSIHEYGGTVFFPKSVYYLSSELVVKNSDTVRSAYGISMIGEGFQSCLYMPSGSDNILDLQYYGSAVTNRPVAGFYLGHMSFYGGTTGTAIYAQRVIHSLFENIWIRTAGKGIYLYGAENNTFNGIDIGSSVPSVYRPGYATGKPSGGAVGATNTYGLYLQKDNTAGLLAGTQIASENIFNGLAVENCSNDGIYMSETFSNVFNGTSKGHTGYAVRLGGGNNDEFHLFVEACTGDDTGYGAGGGTTAFYISGSRWCVFKVYADSVKARLLGGSHGNMFLGCTFEDVIIEAASQPNTFISCNIDNSWTDVAGSTGQNIISLTVGMVNTLAEVKGNTAWDYNRGQFKVYTGVYWHYYGHEFLSPETANFTVEITDSNTSFVNNAATGTIVGSLPDAVAGYGPYIFTVTESAGQDIQVDPLGTDIIEGGAAGYSLELDNRGDSATLKCYAAGIWSITGFYGTLAFIP